MHRVMIVDDEMLARVGMKVLIPWEENGFHLVGEFDNGRKALEAAKELKPDIIITDVKMPVLGGIDLMRELRASGQDIKFIIMSSYDDFHYVKEAMKLGAEDYLLKMEVEPDKLLQMLNSIAAKLREEREERERHRQLEHNWQANLSSFKRRFIQSVLLGHLPDPGELERECRLFQLPFEGQVLACLAFHRGTGEEAEQESEEEGELDGGLREQSVINMVEDAIQHIGRGAACSMRTGLFAAILSLDNGAPEQMLPRLAANIRELLKNVLNVQITIGISGVFNRYAEAGAAYRQALRKLDQTAQKEMISQQEEPRRIVMTGLPLEKELSQLEDMLRSCQLERADMLLAQFTAGIEQMDELPLQSMIGIGHVLIFIMNAFGNGNRFMGDDIWEGFGDPYQQVSEIESKSSFITWIDGLRKHLLLLVELRKDDKLVILKAKKYMRAHFLEDISLKSVADHLALSPSYFSRMFSQETEQTFIDYLIELRIDYAKELLHTTNAKVYQISQMAGYDNPHYFSRLFKKVTGLSPGEYRDFLANKEQMKLVQRDGR
ncbi:response regulator [Paenibacillus sp. GCM10027626]|uniref:response regulator n=1 Tax=Paenibacillus sp. GCM10027626 TaxID=3273411 RepID=UPI00362BBDF1